MVGKAASALEIVDYYDLFLKASWLGWVSAMATDEMILDARAWPMMPSQLNALSIEPAVTYCMQAEGLQV